MPVICICDFIFKMVKFVFYWVKSLYWAHVCFATRLGTIDGAFSTEIYYFNLNWFMFVFILIAWWFQFLLVSRYFTLLLVVVYFLYCIYLYSINWWSRLDFSWKRFTTWFGNDIIGINGPLYLYLSIISILSISPDGKRQCSLRN